MRYSKPIGTFDTQTSLCPLSPVYNQGIYMYMERYAHICISVYMNMCMHVYVYLCKYMNMYTYMYVHVYAYMWCVCVCERESVCVPHQWRIDRIPIHPPAS